MATVHFGSIEKPTKRNGTRFTRFRDFPEEAAFLVVGFDGDLSDLTTLAVAGGPAQLACPHDQARW